MWRCVGRAFVQALCPEGLYPRKCIRGGGGSKGLHRGPFIQGDSVQVLCPGVLSRGGFVIQSNVCCPPSSEADHPPEPW